MITALHRGGCKDERQHGAGRVGWAVSRGNHEMHFSIPFLAAGFDSKWVPICCSSIFENAGLPRGVSTEDSLPVVMFALRPTNQGCRRCFWPLFQAHNCAQTRESFSFSPRRAGGSGAAFISRLDVLKVRLQVSTPCIMPHTALIGVSACIGNGKRRHQFSPNGLTSASNVQAERGCRASHSAVAAMSSGFRKKLSGLSGMFRRA